MMGRTLAALSAAAALSACQTGGPAPAATHERPLAAPDHAPAAPTSSSGLVLFGAQTLYLASTPSAPGRSPTLVLEITLAKDGQDPGTIYTEDRRLTGERTYTLVPDPFPLTELLGATGGLPQRTQFKGTLWRGRSGRGGAPFLAGVTVNVSRVVYPGASAGTFTGPGYFLFGDARELFALRVRGDDAAARLLAVRVRSGILSHEQAASVRRGALVAAASPWTVGDAPTARVALAPGEKGSVGRPQELELEILSSLP